VDPAWIKPSLVLMTLWGVSGTMLIFLAALKNVPRDLYEVAELDGAGPVRRFFNITVPMISPTIFFNVIVLSIAALQVFDTAYLIFSRDQGQATPDAALFYAIYLFQVAFRNFNFGLASAMAWLLFVLILLAAGLLGVLAVLPIGGADMPVVISTLNAFTGLSAAAAGIALDNVALIVAGMLVGASGSILTKQMAEAMNRSIPNIFLGGLGAAGPALAAPARPPG
jgi:NAD/NADP transhydrogenase beta subunit